eukprot:CAMPEP_0201521114 /NCGR_PEP_ID=MMETSP0161_2-20130828/14228_1 /ASSEMBLY_ACC=CAM_ASM_000251 /TAXON_ID=180227 /ORGANISM="Neoparamoeba aestuarina, Strain SoJaBio B1-5/56/2" /LENGTH=156 /DNA_ID=CAMNT_0047919691 /DNA_START=25 /DNA_END=495 /DNA_ORIENTATION=+
MVKSHKASRGGCGVQDVEPNLWIEAFAQHLKAQGKLQVPDFVDYAKTGTSRILPPSNPDWFYVKSAAILRRIYIRPFTGIGGLKKVFGGVWGKNRPLHFRKASGSVIRKSLQALEALNLIAKSDDEGRVITKIGRRDCDRIAMTVSGRTSKKASKN